MRRDEYIARLAGRSRRSVADVVELCNERAAIREYDGGMKRADAERFALDDVANIVLRGCA